MIEIVDVEYRYPGSDSAALSGANLQVERGQLILVAGPSGGGKSTLLRSMNGLVPHFHGGGLRGSVTVDGRPTEQTAVRQMADRVGFIGQSPEDHGVVDRVEDDIAFTLENLGLDPSVMRKRVEEALDALGIAMLRGRRLDSLSGGERQRAAIATVLAAMPRFLVLDEPTSQLDPQSAEEVLSAVLNLRDSLGIGIVLSEHRLERVLQYADQLCHVVDGRTDVGPPADVLAQCELGPPVVHLARALGWNPLPLGVRQALKLAEGVLLNPAKEKTSQVCGDVVASIRSLNLSIGTRSILRGLDLEVSEGEVVAIMGRNGSGKTTLLRAIAGLAAKNKGTIEVNGTTAFVPQDPARILFRSTVADELHSTLKGRGLASNAEAVRHESEMFEIDLLLDRHPLDLSGGQKTKVALAAACAGAPRLTLLDEPTRGMDDDSKDHLGRLLAGWARAGRAVLLSTHDVELAARVADRVVILADGEVVVDAPPHQALSRSLTFSTQMSKVFQRSEILTLADALGAIH